MGKVDSCMEGNMLHLMAPLHAYTHACMQLAAFMFAMQSIGALHDYNGACIACMQPINSYMKQGYANSDDHEWSL